MKCLGTNPSKSSKETLPRTIRFDSASVEDNVAELTTQFTRRENEVRSRRLASEEVYERWLGFLSYAVELKEIDQKNGPDGFGPRDTGRQPSLAAVRCLV